jgi:uncharacterized protein (DUF58 family)
VSTPADDQIPLLGSGFMLGPVLVLVGISLFVALLQQQRDLILLSLLLLVAGVGALFWARLTRGGIVCRLRLDRPVAFPGENLTVTLEIENRHWLPAFLRATLPVGRLASPERVPLRGEGGLLWYQTLAFRWTVPAARRGVHRLGPHRLASGDLFGFFARAETEGEAFEVVIYPRIAPVRPFPLPRRDFFGIPGAEGPIKDPVFILGTRDYQHGHPAKHIHWKASARHHRIQEKLFESTVQEKILLVVEVSEFARQGAAEEFERALEVAASLALRLDREGCAVGLLTNGAIAGGGAPRVPIGRGPGQLPAILELLARLDMTPTGPLLELLRNGGGLSWGVTCLCLARAAEGDALPALDHLARRRVPTICFTSDPGGAGEAGGAGSADIRPVDSILLQGGAS